MPRSASAVSRVLLLVLAGLASPLGLAPGQEAPGLTDQVFPGTRRDAGIPTPEAFIGRTFGRRYTPHHQVIAYARAVAEASPRVRFEAYGRSAQGRPLAWVAISHPDNLARLDAISEATRALQSGSDAAPDDLPVTVWMGMTVHGDEASGTEAGLVLLHHLASAQGDAVRQRLENGVLVIDLVQNPDGRARFVATTENRTSASPQPSRFAHDHRQPWPGGRTNHYLFDLNRDWVFQTQVESRARVTQVLRFLPQVAGDLHEMGTESEYYFSTPPAEPVNQHVSPEVRELWKITGDGIAKAFDARAWPYWTADVFPGDFPGYGGAWPCLLGAAGITYEQASPGAGQIRRADGSMLTLAEATGHHAVAAHAAFAAAAGARKRVLGAFVAHYRRVANDGRNDVLPTFVFSPRSDPDRLGRLATMLQRNGIEVRWLARAATLKMTPLLGKEEVSESLPAGSLVVSARQPLRPLVLSLLDPTIVLDPDFLAAELHRCEKGQSSEIYDVTAWNLPLHFGIDGWRSGPVDPKLLATEDPTQATVPPTRKEDDFPRDLEGAVAALVPGRRLEAPRILAELCARGIKVQVAPFPFTLEGRSYERGTLVIPRARNRGGLNAARGDLNWVREVMNRREAFVPVKTSRTEQGHDLGSRRMISALEPRIVVASGRGVGGYSFGGVRWLLEQGVPVPHACVDLDGALARALEEANVLVLPSGRGYAKGLPKKTLESFLERGGTIVALGGAARWLAGKEPGLLKLKKKEGTWPDRGPGGPIVRAHLDVEHWVGYGLDAPLAVTAKGANWYATPTEKSVKVVAHFGSKDELLLSGHLRDDEAAALENVPLIVEQQVGRGRIVAFLEDVTVRGCQVGLWRLFLNACLLGPAKSR